MHPEPGPGLAPHPSPVGPESGRCSAPLGSCPSAGHVTPRGSARGPCVHLMEPLPVSSVTQSCPTLCDPMDCSMPGFPVHHQIPELTQTHVHRVSDAIQQSHALSSHSPPAFNLSQHQSLSNESVLCIKWPKYLNHREPQVPHPNTGIRLNLPYKVAWRSERNCTWKLHGTKKHLWRRQWQPTPVLSSG